MALTETQVQEFKARLEKERDILKRELSSLGSRNPDNPADWEPAKPAGDTFDADRNENADIVEALHENNAAMNELEARLSNVNLALTKIEKGTYGVCEESGDDIELERLNANPAARMCLAHMKKEPAS
ncbi:MAG: TraR/DksA family transcriptional regulator [Candidatus Paceibacteria bacterium]